MTTKKSGITFPPPKGKQGAPAPAQDPRRRPPVTVPPVAVRTRASTKGR